MGVGIDVAKAELVVGVRPTGTGWTAVNDDHGVRDLVTRMQALGPTLIVLEVTGGDQLLCVAALAAAGAFGARHSHPGVRSVPAAIGCRRATPSGRPPRRGGGGVRCASFPPGRPIRPRGDWMPTGNAVRTATEARRRAAGRPLRARRPSRRGRRSRRMFAGHSTEPD